MKGELDKLRQNHALMMVICCSLPLILLVAAVYFFGLGESYLFWAILLLCPIMHYFMMKDMHKKTSDKKEDNKCH